MKKIFISIPWFLPAYRAGGPVQSIANLVSQDDLGYHFYIFCGDTDLNGESLDGISTNEWIDHNKNTRVYYAGAVGRREVLKHEIEKIRPDVIFVIGLFSRDFNIAPFLLKQFDKTIISVRGMLHPGALSQKPVKKKVFLTWFKLMGFPAKFRFHATDELEAGYIRQVLGSRASVLVAGNYPRLFSPGCPGKKKAGTLRLMCLALISPMKNHLMVLEALAGSTADIEFHIAGAVKDPGYWQTCQDKIKQLPSNIQVTMHGELSPDKVRDWLVTGDVFIMPSKSENFGHALIEAMSAGLPAITSHFTPWNGLKECMAGYNVALTTSSICEAVNFFAAMDEPHMNEWRQAASAFAHSAVDRSGLQEQYNRLFAIQS